MATFEDAVELILEHEGGYVNHKSDPGGETNYGISKRAYPEVDIKGLTKQTAAEIYRTDYWNKIKGDDLPFPLALVTLDAAVNSGTRRASQWLQKAVGATPDGAIGAKTIVAANVHYGANPESAISHCIDIRQQFLRSLKHYQTFGRGWETRLEKTLKEAKKWIETS